MNKTTANKAPSMMANRELGNMGDWQGRHDKAVLAPTGPERPIIWLLVAWQQYAEWHRARYESFIGDDGVLGAGWGKIGEGIHGLLDGDCGRLDCGTLSTFIREFAEFHHYEGEI